ncbi:MAG: DUF6249 domain-containing protein [Limisphaerales bacterium]
MMKMNRFSTNTFAALFAASLWFATSHLGHADDATNSVASHATNRFGLSIDIDTGHKNTGAENYYGLPKETFDRLSPDQIMQLAQAHQKTFVSEQLPDTIITILIPIAMFSMIAVCVWLGVSSRVKRNRLLHDTLRLMIEKGQPIPPELLQPADPQRRPRNDLRTGLIFISVGIGSIWFFYGVGGSTANIWGLGLIPLLMGFAFLITWKIEANKNGQPK